MSVISDEMTVKMCDVFYRKDLANEPRFTTTEGRKNNRAEIKHLIGEIFAIKSTSRWIARLGAADIPVAPVHSIEQLLAFPQLEYREV